MYTERVLEAVGTLRDHVMPNFAEKVEMAVEALSSEPGRETDENEFIDASRLVYDGVRDIRRAVLMNREPDDIADESDLEDEFDKSSMYSTNTNTGQSGRGLSICLLSLCRGISYTFSIPYSGRQSRCQNRPFS